jgi:hypothetical protein
MRVNRAEVVHMTGIYKASRPNIMLKAFGTAIVGATMLLGGAGVANAAAAPGGKPAQATSKKHPAEHAAKTAMKTVKGSVVRVDDAGKLIVVKTAKGTEETFDLGADVTADSVKAMKTGAKVTVHYSEEGGKKVAHALKH